MSDNDSNVSYYAMQIRNALDDTMERTAQGTGNSDLIDQLARTRLQYKNMMTFAPLAAKSVYGTISPVALNQAVTSKFANRASQGADSLGELAQIGRHS